MNNKYEEFLINVAVINIKSAKEFREFAYFMEKLGLEKIKYMLNIENKYGFEKGFCYNAGIKICKPEDVCFEYQLGKGFTFSSIENYKNNPNYIVCTLDDIKIATDYFLKVDNAMLERPPRFNIYPYVRFNTEESLKRFYGIDKIEKQASDINKYKPIEGFYDLREYSLPKEIFIKLWRTQLFLKSYQDDKDKYIHTNPDLWQRLKEISGEYQHELLKYPRKEFIDEKNNFKAKELAKKYVAFIDKYEKYISKNQKNVDQELENQEELAKVIYNVVKEQYEKRYNPWKSIPRTNLLETLTNIFSTTHSSILNYIGALDQITDDFWSPAMDELEEYNKRNNISMNDDELINCIEELKTKDDLDANIYSSDTINFFDIYKEANILEDELDNLYKDLKKEMDIEEELEK